MGRREPTSCTALVSCGCRDRGPRPGALKPQDSLSPSSGGEKRAPGCGQGCAPSGGPFLPLPGSSVQNVVARGSHCRLGLGLPIGFWSVGLSPPSSKRWHSGVRLKQGGSLSRGPFAGASAQTFSPNKVTLPVLRISAFGGHGQPPPATPTRGPPTSALHLPGAPGVSAEPAGTGCRWEAV